MWVISKERKRRKRKINGCVSQQTIQLLPCKKSRRLCSNPAPETTLTSPVVTLLSFARLGYLSALTLLAAFLLLDFVNHLCSLSHFFF